MANSFGSSKINKCKSSGNFLRFVEITLLRLVQVDVQDGVTSAGGQIHALTSHLAVLQACVDDRHSLLYAVHWYFD